MNPELIEAIRLLEKERGLDAETLFAAIEDGLVAACKREFDARSTDNIRAEINRVTGEMRVFTQKEVVEEVDDPNAQLSLADAQALSEDFEVGDMLEFELAPQDFGRLAAQTAKSTIVQKLSEAEHQRIQDEFSSRIGELATGVIQRRDRSEVIVDIGRAEAVMPRSEQVRGESYNFNQRMRFYVLKVSDRSGRPVVYVSRSHPNLVRKLFEQEVPEVADGIVEIVSVAREAGFRSKIAVASRDPNVDALGACVGTHGMRVQAVISELGGEKIDIIEWDPALERFISNALSPARVLMVMINEPEREAMVVVPNQQLSLAIGREGQNVRLAAHLTGWKIDIKDESQYAAILAEGFTQAVEEAAEQYDEESLLPETDYEDPEAVED
ncbi:MAG: transcription termination factor NusA [Bacillota bacterium]|nr:transcription termination factor NusA [Bacillota bacterium]